MGRNDEAGKIGMGGSLANPNSRCGEEKECVSNGKERRLSTQAIYSGGFIPDMVHQFQLRLRL